jgi:uncharacterized alkaline shock family protein YloU
MSEGIETKRTEVEGRYLGKVEVSLDAIATMAGKAALQCYGVVGMSSSRLSDDIAEVLQQENYRRGVKVHSAKEGKIIIDLYVVVEYGTRISEVARNIMSTVKFTVEKGIGLPVGQVNVNVQGLRISDKE